MLILLQYIIFHDISIFLTYYHNLHHVMLDKMIISMLNITQYNEI